MTRGIIDRTSNIFADLGLPNADRLSAVADILISAGVTDPKVFRTCADALDKVRADRIKELEAEVSRLRREYEGEGEIEPSAEPYNPKAWEEARRIAKDIDQRQRKETADSIHGGRIKEMEEALEPLAKWADIEDAAMRGEADDAAEQKLKDSWGDDTRRAREVRNKGKANV